MKKSTPLQQQLGHDVGLIPRGGKGFTRNRYNS